MGKYLEIKKIPCNFNVEFYKKFYNLDNIFEHEWNYPNRGKLMGKILEIRCNCNGSDCKINNQ